MFVCRKKIDMCIKFAAFRQLEADIIRNCLTIAKKNFFSRKKKKVSQNASARVFAISKYYQN